jgi:hypothetical protein
MTSRYEHLVQVAKQAEQTWIDRNNRVQNFVGQFLNKFARYCEMPAERLRLLPWIEEAKVFQAKADEVYGITQAIHYDEEMEEWGVGVCILLTAPKSFPRQTVTAGLFIKEKDYTFLVRMGTGRASENIDLNVQSQCESFFDAVLKQLSGAFGESKNGTSEKNGFRIESIIEVKRP